MRMHADDFAECLPIGLAARGARGRGEARRPRDILTGGKALLEARLARQGVGAYAIAALAQRPRSLAHHGRPHQRLLAAGVLWQASIRAPRGLSSGLVARAGSLACEAGAGVAQPEGSSRS